MYQSKMTNFLSFVFFLFMTAAAVWIMFNLGMFDSFLDRGSGVPLVPITSGGEPEITVYDGPPPVIQPIQNTSADTAAPRPIGGVPGVGDPDVGGGSPVEKSWTSNNVQPASLNKSDSTKPKKQGVMGSSPSNTKGEK